MLLGDHLELVNIAEQEGGIRRRVGHFDKVCMLEGPGRTLRYCFVLRSYVQK